jgi:3-deoxy-D-manno-octulosonic-acid transferase
MTGRSPLVRAAELCYSAGTAILAPFFAMFIRFRSRTPYGTRWRELLGYVPETDYGSPVWFHTVSVGESMGAKPLIMEFRKTHPDIPVLVTTTTATGAAVYDSVRNMVTHLYAPLDSPLAVKRFLNRVNPRLYVTMETELWPVLLGELKKRGIPALVMNARLSDRSRDRYLRAGKLFPEAIGDRITRFICQTPADLANFAKLGIPDSRLAVSGSIKFDITPDTRAFEEGRALRKRLSERKNPEGSSLEESPDREPLFLTVASTHRGEDPLALEMFREIRKTVPSLVLVLVPRHPERFQEVWDLIGESGFRRSRRTQLENELKDPSFALPEVILGDSMQELYLYFGMADLTLMGGSLIDIGGHNPLEPAALGVPVVTGPFIRNFRKIFQEMAAKKASRVIPNETLARDLAALLRDPEELKKLGLAAREFIDENRGALQKTLEEINRILDAGAEDSRQPSLS